MSHINIGVGNFDGTDCLGSDVIAFQDIGNPTTYQITSNQDPFGDFSLQQNVSLFQVALGEVDMAIGGDQGGSIRIPASFCGIVGLKPTHGLVPYSGAQSIEPSVDHLGPMARSVQDVAELLNVSDN